MHDSKQGANNLFILLPQFVRAAVYLDVSQRGSFQSRNSRSANALCSRATPVPATAYRYPEMSLKDWGDRDAPSLPDESDRPPESVGQRLLRSFPKNRICLDEIGLARMLLYDFHFHRIGALPFQKTFDDRSQFGWTSIQAPGEMKASP